LKEKYEKLYKDEHNTKTIAVFTIWYSKASPKQPPDEFQDR